MRLPPWIALSASLLVAPASGALLIDDFSTAQGIAVSPLTGAEDSHELVDAGVLGGERDLYLLRTAGTTMSLTVGGGSADLREIAPADGQVFITWDGADGAPTIDHGGLGGLDLTVGGSQDALSIDILLNAAPTTTLSFLAYSSASDYSQATFSAPAGASTVTVMFSDFVTLAGAGVDFANLGALALFVDAGDVGQAIDFGTIQTTAAPEPSSAALLGLGIAALARARRRR